MLHAQRGRGNADSEATVHVAAVAEASWWARHMRQRRCRGWRRGSGTTLMTQRGPALVVGRAARSGDACDLLSCQAGKACGGMRITPATSAAVARSRWVSTCEAVGAAAVAARGAVRSAASAESMSMSGMWPHCVCSHVLLAKQAHLFLLRAALLTRPTSEASAALAIAKLCSHSHALCIYGHCP